MSDYIEIGSAPYDEECAQVGSDNYTINARRECRAYVNQLKRQFPKGRFGIKSFQHDFGSYYEVVAYYDTEEETQAAFDAEGNSPANWDNEARIELGLPIIEDGSPLDEIWQLMKKHNLTRDQAITLLFDMECFERKRARLVRGMEIKPAFVKKMEDSINREKL